MDHSNDTTTLNISPGFSIRAVTWNGPLSGIRSVKSHERTLTLKKLIDAGYIDRLLPSHDALWRKSVPCSRGRREKSPVLTAGFI
jgi:hypothetical protein